MQDLEVRTPILYRSCKSFCACFLKNSPDSEITIRLGGCRLWLVRFGLYIGKGQRYGMVNGLQRSLRLQTVLSAQSTLLLVRGILCSFHGYGNCTSTVRGYDPFPY